MNLSGAGIQKVKREHKDQSSKGTCDKKTAQESPEYKKKTIGGRQKKSYKRKKLGKKTIE